MKVLRDTWLIFLQQARVQGRNPVQVVIGVFQPITFMVFFAPLLGPALSQPMGVRSGAEVYSVFVPGMLVLIAMLGGLLHGFSLIADLRSGIVERCRVTPISRVALLLGRSLRSVAVVLMQAVIITALGLFLGLSVHTLDLLLAYLMLVLVAAATSATSYGMALKFRSEQALASVVNTVSQPAMLLSGVLLPLALAPAWLQTVANFNPFFWAVSGARALFAGNLGDDSVWKGFAVSAVLAVVAIAWASRAFARGAR
jgi:ABC-2 type transport system permease protein